MALLVLAGSGAAVLTEASCLGYVHPAVLAQGLATVWQLGQGGPWMGHYNVRVSRGNTCSTRVVVCSWRVAFIYTSCRANLYSRNLKSILNKHLITFQYYFIINNPDRHSKNNKCFPFHKSNQHNVSTTLRNVKRPVMISSYLVWTLWISVLTSGLCSITQYIPIYGTLTARDVTIPKTHGTIFINIFKK